MNTTKPATPQSTVVGIPVPLPNEVEFNPNPPIEYAKNELPEWIKPNPDTNDSATGVIFEVLEFMFFLFCLNMLFDVLGLLF